MIERIIVFKCGCYKIQAEKQTSHGWTCKKHQDRFKELLESEQIKSAERPPLLAAGEVMSKELDAEEPLVVIPREAVKGYRTQIRVPFFERLYRSIRRLFESILRRRRTRYFLVPERYHKLK